MKLYAGKPLRGTVGSRYSNIKYGALKCDRKKGDDEALRCTIKATGTCMAADSHEFNIKCKSGKRAYARMEFIRKRVLRIVTIDGTTMTLSPSTVDDLFKPEKIVLMPKYSELPPPKTAKEKAWEDLASSMCQGEYKVGALGYLKNIIKRKVENDHKKLLARCKKLRKNNKEIPEKCKPAKHYYTGGLRG